MAAMDKRTLDREISEYEDGKLNRTNARDLAALYIIRDYLYPELPGTSGVLPGRSYAGATASDTVPEYGDTPFFQAVAGKDQTAAWKVMGQLMDTLAAVSDRLYKATLQQLEEI